MSAAVVIPVYNETSRVYEVIGASQASDGIDEVIVVNDGSTDDTRSVLEDFAAITLLSHAENMGKGEALDTGMQHARREGHEFTIFLDGDLRGIEPEHIGSLLEPLSTGSPMTIGYLGLRKAVVKRTVLSQWGALSGQRGLRVGVWDLLSDKDKHGFNIEAALNARLRKQGLHRNITRVALEGVGHVGKHEKLGSWPRALSAYSKTYSTAFLTYARIEAESLGVVKI